MAAAVVVIVIVKVVVVVVVSNVLFSVFLLFRILRSLLAVGIEIVHANNTI